MFTLVLVAGAIVVATALPIAGALLDRGEQRAAAFRARTVRAMAESRRSQR